MALESINLEHLPASYNVNAALFRDVKNASFLHQQLLAGNSDFEYAFVDASVVVSRLHALAAAYRAVNDLLGNKLRSRNVHSEIVFSFSPNNNIAESFRRFGISPETTNLLVIKISTPSSPASSEAIQAHLSKVVEGEQVDFSDVVLHTMTDIPRVKKIYKLNTTASVNGQGKRHAVNGDGKTEDENKELEMLILGSMALRGASN